MLGTSDRLYQSSKIENGSATVSSFTLLLVGAHPVVYGCERLMTALHIMSHKQYSCTQCRTHWSCTRIKQRGYSLYTDWHSLEARDTQHSSSINYISSSPQCVILINLLQSSIRWAPNQGKQLSASTMPHFRQLGKRPLVPQESLAQHHCNVAGWFGAVMQLLSLYYVNNHNIRTMW